MAPENEKTEQPTPSDIELLGFDPESDGTPLESETKRVEALEAAQKTESQAQERPDEVKPAEEPASQAEGDKGAAPASKAEKDGADPKVEKVETVEEGFSFNGKTYKTEGEAEHARSSFRGQLKARDERVLAAEQENAELKAKLAESERLSQTPAKPDAEPKKPASEDVTKAKGLDDFVNWRTYQDLYDKDENGPATAQRYLALKNQEYLDSMTEGLEEKFTKALADKLEPMEMNEAVRVEFEETIGHFTELSERVDDDGNKLFPEIQNDTGDIDFISRVTTRYHGDEELKEMGSYGVYLAVLAERDWDKYHVPPVEKVTDEPPKEPEKPEEPARDPKTGKFTKASEALTKFNAEQEAAKSGSVVPDGGGTPRLKPGQEGRKPGSWEDNVLTGLEKAAGDQEDKMVLGF